MKRKKKGFSSLLFLIMNCLIFSPRYYSDMVVRCLPVLPYAHYYTAAFNSTVVSTSEMSSAAVTSFILFLFFFM